MFFLFGSHSFAFSSQGSEGEINLEKKKSKAFPIKQAFHVRKPSVL
jgi:hypothetical protein